MDTSKEYINICEKAEEIQELWNWSDGDFVHSKDRRNYSIHIIEQDMRDHFNQKEYIWLPRQDQLQEILSEDEAIYVILTEFNEFAFGEHDYHEILVSHQSYPILLLNWAEKGTGFEVLWLAFFMKKKYNKIWNYEDWIEVKKDEKESTKEKSGIAKS